MLVAGLTIDPFVLSGYSQIGNNETDVSNSSEQIGTLQQNTSNNLSGYSEFVGKGISLFYPTEWRLEEAQVSSSEADRFGISTDAERLRISNDGLKSQISIQFFPTELQEYGLSENVSQANIESSLDQIFPEYILKPFLSEMEYGSLTELEKPVYDKYLIDGHKTGSAAYTAIYGELPIKNVLVGTIIGNNSLGISYGAPTTAFDQIVPIAENIIESIRISE